MRRRRKTPSHAAPRGFPVQRHFDAMGPDDRRSVELGEECAFEAQESSVSDGDSVERMAGLEDFTDVVAHRADLDHMDIFSLAAQDRWVQMPAVGV